MEENEEYKKITMLDQISISVSSPKNYKHLLKLKNSRLVWFIILVSFILAFIEFGIDAIFWVSKVGGFRNLALNGIPRFTFENQKLSMERDVQIEIGGAILYINTDNSEVDLNKLELDGVYITIGSEYLVMGIVSGGTGYTYMKTPLKYMILGDGFDNETLASYSPLFYAYIVFMFICMMIGAAAKQLLLALIFSIVGNTMAKNLHTGLTYGKVFVICVYAMTLAVFIMSLNVALSNIIPSFAMWLVTMFIAMMFMNRAILSFANLDVPPGDVF